MTSREEFRFLADLVLTRSAGDHTMVTLHDLHAGTTRFANNQVVQNTARHVSRDGGLRPAAGHRLDDGFYGRLGSRDAQAG
jgi:hypothetical protein